MDQTAKASALSSPVLLPGFKKKEGLRLKEDVWRTEKQLARLSLRGYASSPLSNPPHFPFQSKPFFLFECREQKVEGWWRRVAS